MFYIVASNLRVFTIMSYNYNIFSIKNNNIHPEKGNILIAEPFIQDKYFSRGVVFLVEHDNINGSMGFVVNKPLKESLGNFFPEINQTEEIIPLFRGGPVCTDKLYYIHTLGDIIPNSFPIGNGLYFDGDFNVIKNYILQGNPVKDQIKFFLGFSGWDEHQLEKEVSNNSWVISKVENSRIMRNEGEICWKKSLLDFGDRYKSWANFPKRPFLN